MKKVTIVQAAPRVLLAVVGIGGGLFVRSYKDPNKSTFLDPSGCISSGESCSLEKLVSDQGRTGIYAGDKVEIQF